jgi:pyridoxamine 5'-phosphate oxidase
MNADAATWRSRRVQYETEGLDIDDVATDPLGQWRRWYAEAEEAGCIEPNAMVLSTAGLDGTPDSRYVLTRDVTERGFVFYTNFDSVKGAQLDAVPRAAGLFTWLQLHRQMRVRGSVRPVADDLADAYFATRPRESQLGAWSSPQSAVLVDRAELEARVANATARFEGVERIPRPANWGGYELAVQMAEVWQGRPSRLHDRLRYRPDGSGRWIIERLSP